MAALNDGVQRLRQSIAAEPLVDDVAHISVMTFSDTAKVVMPLSQMSETAMPTLSVEGGTNYGEAFRELARVIPADAAALKARGTGSSGPARSSLPTASRTILTTGRRSSPPLPTTGLPASA